jgi:hypothetical protein
MSVPHDDCRTRDGRVDIFIPSILPSRHPDKAMLRKIILKLRAEGKNYREIAAIVNTYRADFEGTASGQCNSTYREVFVFCQ